jgi:hypothetical protein
MNNEVVSILVALAVLVVWFALTRYVLPRMGVPT